MTRTDTLALAAEYDQLARLDAPITEQDRQMASILEMLREQGIDTATWMDAAVTAIEAGDKPTTLRQHIRRTSR